MVCFSHRKILDRADLFFSFIGGFVLSLLGTIFLWLGDLVLFACEYLNLGMHVWEVEHRCLSVLYGLGTVVSLVGTGFLIGVRLLSALLLEILH